MTQGEWQLTESLPFLGLYLLPLSSVYLTRDHSVDHIVEFCSLSPFQDVIMTLPRVNSERIFFHMESTGYW